MQGTINFSLKYKVKTGQVLLLAVPKSLFLYTIRQKRRAAQVTPDTLRIRKISIQKQG